MPIEPNDPFAQVRTDMVVEQLQRRGIRSAAVLDVMAAVPRHHFVAAGYRDRAYEDSALPSQDGQTISQPYIVAVMTEALDIQKHHTILEIGTGTGYQTAILALLGRAVFTIERVAGLSFAARQHLAELQITNVRFYVGDGSRGWPQDFGSSGAIPSFDRIIVTAGAPSEPQPLLDQLAPDGLLIIPEGDASSQTLVTVHKTADGRLERRSLIDCRFVPLVGDFAWHDDSRK